MINALHSLVEGRRARYLSTSAAEKGSRRTSLRRVSSETSQFQHLRETLLRGYAENNRDDVLSW